MSFIKKFIILPIVFVLVFTWAPDIAQAGFGISPPAVQNRDLLRGAHFEQQILLIRGTPEQALKATASIQAPDFPEILGWISIDKGTSFILPKGVNQFPIIISIDVPEDAKYKQYEGYIDIRTRAAEEGAGVSIALGARIKIALGVTDRPAPNFRVRSVEFPNVKECLPIEYLIEVENTGNVETTPTRIELSIFHGYMIERPLQTVDIEADDLSKVEAYKTKVITAKFPLKLKPSRYWAAVKIFKGDEVIREDRMFFTVAPGGKIFGLSACDTRSLVWWAVTLILLLAIGYGIWKRYRFGKK